MNCESKSDQLIKARQKKLEIKRKKQESNELKLDAANLKRQSQLDQKCLDQKVAELELEHTKRMKELDEREKNMNAKEQESIERYAVKEAELRKREILIEVKEEASKQLQKYLEDWEERLKNKEQIDPQITTTPIRKFRGPSKTLKPYSELSYAQRRKRESEAKRLGVPLAPNPEAALQVIIEAGIPQKTIRQINAISPKFFPSEHSYQKEKDKILDTFNWGNAPTVGNQNDKVISFAQSLIQRATIIGLNKLPLVPQVTLGVDGGDHLDKVGWFFNNVLKPQSDNNFFELAVSHDPEKYEYIKALFEIIFGDIYILNDFKIDGNFIIFELFFVADLKGLCTCFGHQGPSATYFCPLCYITKTPLIGPINLRTLNDYIVYGTKAEEKREKFGETSKEFKNFLQNRKLFNFSNAAH